MTTKKWPLTEAELEALGVYSSEMLARLAAEEPPFVVEGFLGHGSINILVGGSGLGKTPLAIQLGIAAAAGIPFLGRPTAKSLVLYGDAESGMLDFRVQGWKIANFLGLPGVPDDFRVWNPGWVPSPAAAADRFLETVRQSQPDLVIIDPLRSFFPGAEEKAAEASALFRRLRAFPDTTWLIIHHRRKPSLDGVVGIADDPHVWLNEAAGTQALTNHADGRFGVDRAPQRSGCDLVMGGFVRLHGTFPETSLKRELEGAMGVPVGYRAAVSEELIDSKFLLVLKSFGGEFRFKDLQGALKSTPDSTIAKRLKQALSLGLVERAPHGRGYRVVERDGQ